MAKHLFVTAGVAASLCVAAIPLVAVNAEGENTATTHVRISVLTSVACQSHNFEDTSTDVDFGSVTPGTAVTPAAFIITGSSNSTRGFTVTGVPTALAHLTSASVPAIPYTYGEQDPSADPIARWWVTTSEDDGVEIGSNIVLTSTDPSYDFNLNANAATLSTTWSGAYEGRIDWTCAVQ